VRILLTAFEPFDETGQNSSLEACRRFLSEMAEGLDIQFALLPVRYGEDTAAVEAALREGPFDIILHTGQASQAREIRVERLAVNVRYPADHPSVNRHLVIDPDGPAAFFSRFPVDAAVEAIRGSGIPVTVCNYAGIYLCNHVLYRSLQRAERTGSPACVGFLHLPQLPQQAQGNEPSLPVEQSATAIREALKACSLHDPNAFR
jgi:pyroglutamyl-peptidase